MKLIHSLILLVSLTSISYGQQYIQKHCPGDSIPLDKCFIVLDLQTYSGIRKGAELYRRLSDTDRNIISQYDSIVGSFNDLVTQNNLKITLLMAGINNRDSVISGINVIVNELQVTNKESLGYLEELNKKQKKPWITTNFWIGLSFGSLATLLLLN